MPPESSRILIFLKCIWGKPPCMRIKSKLLLNSYNTECVNNLLAFSINFVFFFYFLCQHVYFS